MNFIKKRYEKIIAGVIIGFGILLRVLNIGKENLWRDEAFSVNLAKNSISEIIALTAADTQPPLHTLSLNLWMRIFGDGEVSVRSLSLIFGIGILVFTYLTAKKIFDDNLLVLFSTLFVALNPLLIFYSQEARAYSMLGLFAIGAFYFSMNLNSKKNLVGFISTSILGLFSHNLFIFVLLSIFSYKFISKFRSHELSLPKLWQIYKDLIISGIAIIIFYVPWIFALSRQVGQVDDEGFWLSFDPIKSFAEAFANFYIFEYPPDSIWINMAVFLGVTGLILGIFYSLTSAKKNIRYLLGFTFLNFAIVYLVSFRLPFFYIRYLIHLSPFVLILSALGWLKFIAFAASKTSLEKSYIPKLLIMFIITITYLFILFGLFYPRNTKADYSELVESVSYENQNSEIVIHPSAMTYHSYKYYADHQPYLYDPERGLPYYLGLAIIEEEEYYDENFSKYDKVWIVRFDWDNNLEDLMKSEGFEKSQTQQFDGNIVYDLWTK